MLVTVFMDHTITGACSQVYVHMKTIDALPLPRNFHARAGGDLKNIYTCACVYTYVYAQTCSRMHTCIYEAGDETDDSQRLRRVDTNLAVLVKLQEDYVS